MKIALLYICTGLYDVFWEDFHRSVEAYFLPQAEKNYYVFTDSSKIAESDRVHVVPQERLPWPYATLFRFKMFNRITEALRPYDYLFFANANLLMEDTIGDEILPENEGLCAVSHPGYWAVKDPALFTYERNPASTAYIPRGEGTRYFMGGFNGGKVSAYLEMSRELEASIDQDLGMGIIAVWHDESHLNRYLKDRSPLVLDPGYGYPEGASLPFSPKILIRDKNKFGGHDLLRGLPPIAPSPVSFVDVFRRFISKAYNKVRGPR